MTGYDEILSRLKEENRFRTFPSHTAGSGLLDLSSNDYMGLRFRETELKNKFADKFQSASMSSSASRLLSVDQHAMSGLENLLETLYGRPAILFNSGYHANVGIIQALAIPNTLFVGDKLIHASMIDGIRLSGTGFRRFPHNNIAALQKTIAKEAGNFDRIWILTESIFSMDGDMAPLEEIVALKNEYPNVRLYLDEAHGFGVRGDKGLGLAEELNLLSEVDILVGTLGKAAFSAGAFAMASRKMIDYMRNCTRSLIFSTALPPINAEWSRLTIEMLMAMNAERLGLKTISRTFRDALRRHGLDVPEGDSPIVPWLIGDAEKAVEYSRRLREKGILALPIRRPTVPPGGERIRFSLNAALGMEDIDRVTSQVISILP